MDVVEQISHYTNRMVDDIDGFQARYNAFMDHAVPKPGDPLFEPYQNDLFWLSLKSGEIVTMLSFLQVKLDKLIIDSGMHALKATRDSLREKIIELLRNFRTVAMTLGECQKAFRARYSIEDRQWHNPLNEARSG